MRTGHMDAPAGDREHLLKSYFYSTSSFQTGPHLTLSAVGPRPIIQSRRTSHIIDAVARLTVFLLVIAKETRAIITMSYTCHLHEDSYR